MLLYTLPRARGTISLRQCKRLTQLNEPFAPRFTDFMDQESWDHVVSQMNATDTVSKIHAFNLRLYVPAQAWYRDVLATKSHDLFVIERHDRLDAFLSDILAMRHGHVSNQLKPVPETFTATDAMIREQRFMLEQHLRYYPTYGTVVTYETLPETHFDKTIVTDLENQHSYLRHSYITNLDQCRDELSKIIECYKNEWDDKIQSLIDVSGK